MIALFCIIISSFTLFYMTIFHPPIFYLNLFYFKLIFFYFNFIYFTPLYSTFSHLTAFDLSPTYSTYLLINHKVFYLYLITSYQIFVYKEKCSAQCSYTKKRLPDLYSKKKSITKGDVFQLS